MTTPEPQSSVPAEPLTAAEERRIRRLAADEPWQLPDRINTTRDLVRRLLATIDDLHSMIGHERCEDNCEVRTAGEVLDALPVPDAPTAREAIAWLIERGQPENQAPTVWWADRKRWGLTYLDDWTEDANKAFRFESREAAEEVIAAKFTPPASRGGPSARAVEHGFISAAALRPTGIDQVDIEKRHLHEQEADR